MSDVSHSISEEELARLRARVEELEAEVERTRALNKDFKRTLARRESHLKNTPAAVIFWDTNYRVVEWNPGAERVFGYSASEAIGTDLLQLVVHEDAREHVDDVVAELLRQTGGTRSVNANVNKNGERIICAWYNTPVTDEEGNTLGVMSLALNVTQQQETAQALAHSAGMLESIVENAPVVIVRVDPSHNIEYINQVVANYSKEQVLGQPATAFVAQQHRHIVQAAIERAFETGERAEYEVQDVANERWFHTHLAPVVEDGLITSVVLISQDVHERREEQKALRESESRLQLVTQQTPAVLWTVDNDLRFTSSTGSGLAQLGLKQNEVVGQSLYAFFQTDDAEFLPIATVLRALQGASENYDLEFADRWFHTHVEPLHGANEDIVGAIGISLDISSLKEAEAEREKSQMIFETLAKNMPGVAYLCENDERYTMRYLSEEIEKLVGIPASEFLEDRVSFTDLFHPDYSSSIPSLVDAAIAQKAPFHLRYRLRHADGHWVWVEEHGQGVFDENGELRFLEGCIFDITTKREAEEALLRSKEELEQLVKVRTQELRTANRLLREDFKQQLELTAEVRESEEQLQHICDNNPAPVSITRARDGTFLYANQRLAELARMPLEDVLSRRSIDFYQHAEQRSTLLTALGTDGVVNDLELQLRRGDGSDIWVVTSIRRIQYNSEDALLAVVLDITDRILSEQKLRSQMRMLRRMLYVHERDRQLIAYEIHDGIVQYMAGANLFLQAAAAKVDSDAPGTRRDLENSSKIISETIEEARRLIDGLQPEALERQGVVPAVQYLCEQTQKLHDVETECVSNVSFKRLAPAVEMAIYRIVQEGLNNIVKHSQSKRARVELSQRNDALVLKIQDWGIGFDPRRVDSKRYGLTGIRDRAKLLGGKARIRTASGEGTKLRVKLPLEDMLLPLGWEDRASEAFDDDSSSDWRLPPSDVESNTDGRP